MDNKSILKGFTATTTKSKGARYFNDCLRNVNDDISFGLGIISLVCWGVAEIPQIITNFRSKSSHGVSLIFLLTWIAGSPVAYGYMSFNRK
ncbi:hypothetical protein LXL04_022859 [Taraxacum kok-saghyz]